MKLWWLRLYTLPSLKKLGWPLLAWLVANVFCALLLPKLRELSYFVGMYPWYVFMNDNENTLANNMDFHRVHVDYQNLRRSQVFDLIIQISFFLLAFTLCGLLPWGMRLPPEILDLLGTTSMALLLYTLVLMILVAVKLGKVKKLQDQRAKTKINWSFSREGIIFSLFLLGAFYFIRSRGLGSYMVVYLFFSAGVFLGIKKTLLEDFHSFPRWNRFKDLDFPLAFLAFYFLTTIFSHRIPEELADKSFSPLQRHQSLQMFRHVDLRLDAESVSELIAHDLGGSSLKLAFEKAEQDVFERDVSELIKDGDYRAYYYYLQTGKAAPHNLATLFKKSAGEREAWKNSHYYGKFREALTRVHPEAKTLPSRLPATGKGGK